MKIHTKLRGSFVSLSPFILSFLLVFLFPFLWTSFILIFLSTRTYFSCLVIIGSPFLIWPLFHLRSWTISIHTFANLFFSCTICLCHIFHFITYIGEIVHRQKQRSRWKVQIWKMRQLQTYKVAILPITNIYDLSDFRSDNWCWKEKLKQFAFFLLMPDTIYHLLLT